MPEYKPNSHKSKNNTNKDIQKVVSGNVRTKKNEVRKFTDIFISEDVSNVKSYVVMDVLVPAVKKAVSDIVTTGIDMILYGETGRTKKSSPSSKVSYRSYYQKDEREHTTSTRANRGKGYFYDEIIFDSRGEAEVVLQAMDEIIDAYEILSVSDLNEMIGVVGTSVDNKFGWTDIRTASIEPRRGEYILKMPKAMPLD